MIQGLSEFNSRELPKSCYDCAGIVNCRVNRFHLTSSEARLICMECRSLHKGRSTEVVRVVGRGRGISRKKAEELISTGRARWVSACLLKVGD